MAVIIGSIKRERFVGFQKGDDSRAIPDLESAARIRPAAFTEEAHPLKSVGQTSSYDGSIVECNFTQQVDAVNNLSAEAEV